MFPRMCTLYTLSLVRDPQSDTAARQRGHRARRREVPGQQPVKQCDSVAGIWALETDSI